LYLNNFIFEDNYVQAHASNDISFIISPLNHANGYQILRIPPTPHTHSDKGGKQLAEFD